MKNLILALMVFFGTLAVQPEKASANGAIVVFLKLRSEQYVMSPAIRDKAFNNSHLFNVLESDANDVFVARIDPYLYRWVSAYGAFNDVALIFNGKQKIAFHYYNSLQAFIGFTGDDETVVLLPQLPSPIYDDVD